RVRVVRAIPLASVVAESGLMLPSPDVSRQVTTAPENGRPSVPVSATCRGMGNGTPTGPAWWSPALTTRADGITGEGPGSPLALLGYLTIARPWGFQRRDTLVALLWPELDHAHARNALNQAVHALRQALGREVLRARGEEEVGTREEGISCDVREFETALEA